MSTKLDEILASTRRRVDERQRARPLGEIVREVERITTAPRGFRKSLEVAAANGVAIIAELKKASPSKGVLRGTFHAGGLAMQFERAGAAALSVLTDEDYFQGSLAYLVEASAATNLPCLRKDFIIDEFQLYEARLNRADAVLLMASVLADPQLRNLYKKARELGLDVLCEVHDEKELARAIDIGADIVGVNSRNLRTLEVDPDVHGRLAALLPKSVLRVAESGIQSGADIRKLLDADHTSGYQAFLVGETLMKADDPGLALTQLIAQASAPSLR
ncbi:MAG: Indole-3-glycerol phosphate synthase [Acidobacteriaceae bacterium]|nr:Indole-3-glycerol phosphate synthase [Acidobacteriaceae bacterium]